MELFIKNITRPKPFSNADLLLYDYIQSFKEEKKPDIKETAKTIQKFFS